MNLRDVRNGPLSQVRVVELAAIGPVPFACMMLADMGAEILRVSPPKERMAIDYIPEDQDPVNRGRSRLALDLKLPDDRERFIDICRHADILVEGFRPGVLERLGIGPDILLEANPRLIIGRMTGWGQTGPYAKVAGHDTNYIGLTGALGAIGPSDRPPPLPLNLVGDYGGGAMFLITGLLAALLSARETGKGQVIDAAMVDGAAMLMSQFYAMYNHGLWQDERSANFLDGSAPFATTYETKDSKYMAVCSIEPQFYRLVLKGLGCPDEHLSTQYDATTWASRRIEFAAIFKSKTRDEWVKVFEGTDACVSPVLSLQEAPNHPANLARGVFTENLMPAPAPRFSHTPSVTAPLDIGDPDDLLKRWRARSAPL